MRIVHLGGSRLGDRILDALDGYEDDLVSADDLDQLGRLLEAGPADWMVSAGFRYLVPDEYLAGASDTCNVHTAFLPWGRGSQPNVWMINSQEPAGVTIHRMTSDLDSGPIFAQRTVETTFGDNAATLFGRLEDAAVELFKSTWSSLRSGEVQPFLPSEAGSFHTTADFSRLGEIQMDQNVTWRQALNTLRALTFPPHRNLVVQEGDRRYHVEISITELELTDAESQPG